MNKRWEEITSAIDGRKIVICGEGSIDKCDTCGKEYTKGICTDTGEEICSDCLSSEFNYNLQL